MTEPTARHPHDEAEELLPWYVTGRLDAADRERVEKHLTDCARLPGAASRRAPARRRISRLSPQVEASWTQPARADRAVAARRPLPPAAAAFRWRSLRSAAAVAVPDRRAVRDRRGDRRRGSLLSASPTPLIALLAQRRSPASANAVVIFQPQTREEQLRRLLQRERRRAGRRSDRRRRLCAAHSGSRAHARRSAQAARQGRGGDGRADRRTDAVKIGRALAGSGDHFRRGRCCVDDPCIRAAAGAAQPDRQIMVMVPHPADHFRPGAAYAGGYGDDLARSARERLARRIAHQFGLTLVDDWPMPMVGVDCFIMAVPGIAPPKQAADQLARNSRVAWTQPVQVYTRPGQRRAAAQRSVVRGATRGARMAAGQAAAAGHGQRRPGRGGRQRDRRQSPRPRRARSRSTATSSPAARWPPSSMAPASPGSSPRAPATASASPGSRPGRKILGLRACWQSPGKTQCDSFSLAKALYFAIDQKAAVINLSLSGPDDRLAARAAQDRDGQRRNRGRRVRPNAADGGFPASVPGVIAVTDASLAGSRGHVYIAPGRDVPTTQPGGRWFLVNGSSFAAAHVSGLFALLRQRGSTISPTLVAHGGYVDACATMAYAGLNCECACGPGATRAALRR